MKWTDDTYKVKHANVTLRVSRDEVNRYFDLGYDVYDLEGNLVVKAVPKDVPTLQKAFVENQNKINELEEEIFKLESQLEEVDVLKKEIADLEAKLSGKKATTRKTTAKKAE